MEITKSLMSLPPYDETFIVWGKDETFTETTVTSNKRLEISGKEGKSKPRSVNPYPWEKRQEEGRSVHVKSRFNIVYGFACTLLPTSCFFMCRGLPTVVPTYLPFHKFPEKLNINDVGNTSMGQSFVNGHTLCSIYMNKWYHRPTGTRGDLTLEDLPLLKRRNKQRNKNVTNKNVTT